MTKSRTRIDSLSDYEKSQMDSWADKWIEIGLRTGSADRDRFEAAARSCYGHAGLKPPETIIWVPNPLVLALAAPMASFIIERITKKNGGAVHGAVDGAVRDAVHGAVRDAVHGAVHGAVDDAVRDAVTGAVDGAVGDAVDGAVRDAVRDAVDGAVHGAVHGAVDDAVRGAVDGAVTGAVDGAVGDAVDGAVDDAVRDAVDGAVDGAVHGAVDGAVRDAVHGAVRDAVHGAVGDAVDGAVGDAVDGAVRDAVHDAVDGAVTGAVTGAVDDAVDGAVRDAVTGAVTGAVDDAVDGAVGDALKKAIVKNWANYIGGQFWCGGWWYGGAWTSYFREICKLRLSDDLWARARDYEATMESACWWWPHRDFIMVSERPGSIYRELVDPSRQRGFGSHRLHNPIGAAVAWDGWGVYAIHGVRVPSWIVEHPEAISYDSISAENNAEVRRVMIERYGEDRYIIDSGMKPVAHDEVFGTLYFEPMNAGAPIAKIRVVNRSPEPDGTFKPYWLDVNPAHYSGDAGRVPQAAVASTWRKADGSLAFKDWRGYAPQVET